MTDLAALVVRMQADNSQYVKALDQATSRLEKFQHEQTAALEELAKKFAEAFAVDKILEFSFASIESAAALDKFAQSAGISAESMSVLNLAAAASGLSTDELGQSLKKLNVNISDAAGNASSKAAVAFAQMGISVRDAGGNLKSADSVLAELATKFQGYADGPNKTALAVALLGKQGQNLIPVLNEGAEGLERFKAQAEAAGLVTSSVTAKAAEELEQRMAVLKATIAGGLSSQIEAQLLPVMNQLATAFEAGGNKGEALGVVATEIVTGIKLVATVVIEVVAQIEKWGSAIGAVGAAAVAVAHGDFAEARAIWADGAAQNVATEKKATDLITALWHEQSAEEIAAAKRTAQAKEDLAKGKGDAPNLAAGIASEAAVKKLEQFRDTIKEQADAFNLGGAALARFKLQTGSLAEDLKKAGDAGQAAAAAAIKYAEALQTKQDNKAVENFTAGLVKQITALDAGGLALTTYELHSGALGDALDRLGKKGDAYRQTILATKGILIDDQDAKAVQALSDKSDILAGRLNKAALSAFDLQNALLKKNLEAQGNVAGEAGLEQLATERAHVDALSKINELNLAAAKIQTDLGVAESKIALARAQGQIGDIQAGNQEAAVRGHAIEQLDDIYAKEKDIAAAANDPALVDGVKKFGVQIDSLKVQMTVFDSQIRQGLEGAFAHNFADLITGAKSFKQALLGFLQDIDKQFVDMIAKDYAQKLFAGASGSSAGGPLGGLSGLLGGLLGGGGGGGGGLASLFGGGSSIASTGAGAAGVSGASFDDLLNTVSAGGLAGGGTIPAGEMRLVGENGPEMAYSGSQDMQVVPNAGKNVNVTNHFSVQSANGTISRQSQMQVAAAAARSLSQASRRNN